MMDSTLERGPLGRQVMDQVVRKCFDQLLEELERERQLDGELELRPKEGETYVPIFELQIAGSGLPYDAARNVMCE